MRKALTLLVATVIVACGPASEEVLPAPTARVSGRILLAGVEDRSGLEVVLAGSTGVQRATTAADGSFVFETVPVGPATVMADVSSTSERARTRVLDLRGDAVTVPDLVFTPLGELSGTVTFGTAAGNAGITVLAGTGGYAKTDDAGAWVLRDVPVGLRDVVAFHPGWQSGTAKGVAVSWRRQTVAPTLVLTKAPSDAGEIVGSVQLTGESTHDGVTVLATGSTATFGAVTDVAGNFRLGGLGEGTWSLTIDAGSTVEGTRTASAVVEKGKTTTLSPVSFTPLGNLQGKVTLGTGPTGNAGILVSVPDAPAVATNDAGEWEIRGVRTGISTIRASKAGYGSQSVEGPDLRWRQTATASSLELKADPTTSSTVAGWALLPGPSPQAGTVVSVSDGGGSVVTGAGGGYFLAVGGAPARRTVTFVSKDGRYRGALEVLLIPGGKALALQDGAAKEIPIVNLVRGTSIGHGVVVAVTPSKELIVVRRDPTTTRLGLDRLTLTGVRTPLVSDLLSYNGVATSQDGRWITFSTSAGWSVLDTASGAVSVLSSSLRSLQFSEDQKSLVFEDWPVERQHVRRLAEATTVDIGLPGTCVVSPSAGSVACFEMDDLRVQRIGSLGAVVAKISTSALAPRPLWTSDERLFFSSDSGALVVFDWKTGGIVEVLSSGAERLTRSPDGRHVLAFRSTSAGTKEVLLVPSGSTLATRIGSSEPVSFSTDSSRLAWPEPSASGVDLWSSAVSSPSSKTRLGPLHRAPDRLWWMGSDAVVAGAGVSFEQLLISTGTSTDIGAQVDRLAWSADQKKLVLSANAYSTPRLVRTIDASGASSQIEERAASLGPFSPDAARTAAVLWYGMYQRYSAAIAGGVLTPLGWPRKLDWVSTTEAVLGNIDDSMLPNGYPSGDDTLWLTTFP